MSMQYDVMSPWAEVDPVPAKGISPRLNEISGKTIGFFLNSKIAAEPMSDMIERNFKGKYPSLTFSRFVRIPNIAMAETPDKDKYIEWIKGLDAIIYTHGD